MVFARVFLPNKTPSLDSIDSFLEIYERHKVGALVSCGGGFPSYARPNAEWWVGGVFLVFKSARALGQGGEAAGSVGAAVAAAGGGRGKPGLAASSERPLPGGDGVRGGDRRAGRGHADGVEALADRGDAEPGERDRPGAGRE